MANLEISSQCSFLVFRPPRSKHHLKHCKKPQRKHDMRRGMRCRCEIASVQGSGGRRSAAAAAQDSELSCFLRTVLSQSIRRAMRAARARAPVRDSHQCARQRPPAIALSCSVVSRCGSAMPFALVSWHAWHACQNVRASRRRDGRQAWIMHASHR